MVRKTSAIANINVIDKYPVKIIGKVFSDPSIAMLNVIEAGVFTVLANHLLRHSMSSIAQDEAVDILGVHGLDDIVARTHIKALKVRGVIDISPSGKCTIYSVGEAVESGKREALTRKSAWDRRRTVDGLTDALASSTSKNETSLQVYSNEKEVQLDVQPSIEPVLRNVGDALPLSTQLDNPGEIEVKSKKVVKDKITEARISDSASDETPVIASIKCLNDSTAHITEGYANSLLKMYPGIDVKREIMLSAQWCINNPERRKTLKGIRRFISAWLNNAMNAHHAKVAVMNGSKQGQFGQGLSQTSDPLPKSNNDDDGLGFLVSQIVEQSEKSA